MQQCTFAPEINQISINMLNEDHVPIYEKELPGPKEEPQPKQEEGLDEVYDPHPKRKFNAKFY